MLVKKINPLAFDLVVTRDLLKDEVRVNPNRTRGYEYLDKETGIWWSLPHHHNSLKVQELLKLTQDAELAIYVTFYQGTTKASIVTTKTDFYNSEITIATDNFSNPVTVALALALIDMLKLGIDDVVLEKE